ncbi:guanylate kinase [Aneurinibacillus aneurinilyticus]|uniref:Guanylate kinase n=1 Tax=Aneurinibacillus aneurinilyticus TaxID=1391 RepID=A0A848D3L0_ANEAE|nr:guanylate kinase [Aneurinibacillus aneurinilyticus]MED0672874.1 guanylate kinase [Aneurinibacillus aneurinilyticus]NMF00703.1 guanylate kinase [Aneurinibacillus aneurinilyticus]
MYELQAHERIFVFTGPYGAGRKTVADMVGETLGMQRVIPYTTRPRRSVEVDGQDYHFVSPEQFAQMKANDVFIETIELDHIMYGIKESDIEHDLQKSGVIYLILNHYGTDALKRLYGDKVIRICIHTDPDTIMKKQRTRGYSDEVIRRHLKYYEEENAYKSQCEHCFANNELAHTVFAVSETIEPYLGRNLMPDYQ